MFLRAQSLSISVYTVRSQREKQLAVYCTEEDPRQDLPVMPLSYNRWRHTQVRQPKCSRCLSLCSESRSLGSLQLPRSPETGFVKLDLSPCFLSIKTGSNIPMIEIKWLTVEKKYIKKNKQRLQMKSQVSGTVHGVVTNE